MRRTGNFWPYGLAGIPDQYIQELNQNVFPVPQVWQDEEVLGSAFAITETNGTYQSTGLSIELPDAGTYLVSANVRGVVTPDTNSPGYIVAKLYNATSAADVSNSERLIALSGVDDVLVHSTAPITAVIQVTTATTITVYAKRDGTSTTWTTSSIGSDTNGRTTISAIRLQ